jgi:hypothetical protein
MLGENVVAAGFATDYDLSSAHMTADTEDIAGQGAEKRAEKEVAKRAKPEPARGVTAFATPEYFPGLEFAGLLALVDELVLVDTVQYSRQSRHNRCRIRTPDGSIWLTVPIEGGQFGTSLNDVSIDEKRAWRTLHRKALGFNYRSSPYYDYYETGLETVFDPSFATLGEVTVAAVRAVARQLGSSATIITTSGLVADSTVKESAETWASVATAFGRRTKVLLPQSLGPAVAHLFDSGAATTFLAVDQPEYVQNFDGFVSGLSVLDLLFNAGPEALEIVRQHCRIVGSTIPEDVHRPQTRES